MDRRNFLKSVGASAVLGAGGVAFASNSNASVAFNGIAGYAGIYAYNGYVNSRYRNDYYQSVRNIQWKLGVTADGAFGAQTRSAVINFQRKHGLSADGVVGPATARALNMGWSSSPLIYV